MCILNWCYKYLEKPEPPCASCHPNVLHEDVLSHLCTCPKSEDESEHNYKTKNRVALKAETVHVSFYPCVRPASTCTPSPTEISKSRPSTAPKSTKRLRFSDSPKCCSCSSPEQSYYKTSSVSYSCSCSSPPLQTEFSRSSEENDDEFEIEFSENDAEEEESLTGEESKPTTSAATGEEGSLETENDTNVHGN